MKNRILSMFVAVIFLISALPIVSIVTAEDADVLENCITDCDCEDCQDPEIITTEPTTEPTAAPAVEPTAESPQEISKKNLLQETGISYGQLYRWKREGLIPEEWFEKRSAFTGQETFFSRQRILKRIEIIQSMKDDLSLSDIKSLLDTIPQEANLKSTLAATGGMSEAFINSITVDFEGIWLSELSVKAVSTLCSALDQAQVSTTEQSALISQVIETLSVAVPVTMNDAAATAHAEAHASAHAEAQATAHVKLETDTEATPQSSTTEEA